MHQLLERRAQYDALATVEDLVRAIDAENCTPGWVPREKPLFWPRAHSCFVPAHWRYAQMRPALVAAGRLIATHDAERRNFVLRNPVADNDFATTRTLVGAYQSILPGEKARTHRHSAHALRIIIEARGSYSVVNGEKTPMESGDIVLTPGGHWHGHGHDGREQAFWFDCLDLPLVHLLEPMTFEEHPDQWGEGRVREAERSPLRLPWERTLALLERSGVDPHSGRTVDLSSDLMPTITIKAHSWPAGWTNAPCRQNANQIFVVLRGAGTSDIAQSRFEWAFGDVFVAPLGTRVALTVSADAVVVALSDEGLMKHCGYHEVEACG